MRKLPLTLLICLLIETPAFGIKVAATVLPVYIFAKNVAGERTELSLLIPPGTDIHEFALRPRDKITLDEADLILLNGGGLESHLISGSHLKKAFDTSAGIDLIESDPHLWLDPLRAAIQVKNIASALSAKDPPGGAYYGKNADLYIGKLKALHEEILKGLAGIKTRYLITYHESFRYFARRYGFEFHSLTGPYAEQPLPGRMKTIYDIAGKENIRAVFREEQFPAGPLERLKRDLGVEICALNTLESGRPEAEYYMEAMRENLESIIKCLGGK